MVITVGEQATPNQNGHPQNHVAAPAAAAAAAGSRVEEGEDVVYEEIQRYKLYFLVELRMCGECWRVESSLLSLTPLRSSLCP